VYIVNPPPPPGEWENISGCHMRGKNMKREKIKSGKCEGINKEKRR
jgi:hypothetical protein